MRVLAHKRKPLFFSLNVFVPFFGMFLLFYLHHADFFLRMLYAQTTPSVLWYISEFGIDLLFGYGAAVYFAGRLVAHQKELRYTLSLALALEVLVEIFRTILVMNAVTFPTHLFVSFAGSLLAFFVVLIHEKAIV